MPALDPDSEHFAFALGEAFARATQDTVREHLAAGREVFGIIDGRIVALSPDGLIFFIDTGEIKDGGLEWAGIIE